MRGRPNLKLLKKGLFGDKYINPQNANELVYNEISGP